MKELTSIHWIWLIIAAFFIGFSKTSIAGSLTPILAVLANVFGGKDSTGILLPMLIIGDIFAVFYYHQHTEWSKIKKLLPWVFIGLILGVLLGMYISDSQFRFILGLIVLSCLFILLHMDTKKETIHVSNSFFIYIISGILTGFTTMIGNASGPIFTIYLLTMGFKKEEYLGTTAWTFLIINLIKIPLQIFFWKCITPNTLFVNAVLIPVITIGAILGAIVINKINERIFHNVILVMTAIAGIRLLF